MYSMVVQREVTWLAQLRRGVVEHCVLALLSHGESYGFDIAHTLTETYRLDMSEGTLYPLLARLDRQGLVASTWKSSSNGPSRRYYSITDAGARSLEEFKRYWEVFKGYVDNILAMQGGL